MRAIVRSLSFIDDFPFLCGIRTDRLAARRRRVVHFDATMSVENAPAAHGRLDFHRREQVHPQQPQQPGGVAGVASASTGNDRSFLDIYEARRAAQVPAQVAPPSTASGADPSQGTNNSTLHNSSLRAVRGSQSQGAAESSREKSPTTTNQRSFREYAQPPISAAGELNNRRIRTEDGVGAAATNATTTVATSSERVPPEYSIRKEFLQILGMFPMGEQMIRTGGLLQIQRVALTVMYFLHEFSEDEPAPPERSVDAEDVGDGSGSTSRSSVNSLAQARV